MFPAVIATGSNPIGGFSAVPFSCNPNRSWLTPGSPLSVTVACSGVSRRVLITPGHYYCVSGKVNSADKLYLVIESIKPDGKHGAVSTLPVHPDGAGGSSMR
jgi:hypothetical protein